MSHSSNVKYIPIKQAAVMRTKSAYFLRTNIFYNAFYFYRAFYFRLVSIIRISGLYSFESFMLQCLFHYTVYICIS